MKLDKKTQASVDRLQRRHPLVAARLELEGLKLAHEMKCAEVAELRRRIRLARRLVWTQAGTRGPLADAVDLLDLRKPLTKRGRR